VRYSIEVQVTTDEQKTIHQQDAELRALARDLTEVVVRQGNHFKTPTVRAYYLTESQPRKEIPL